MPENARILLVNDEKEFAETLLTLVRMRGYDVESVTTGKLTLETVRLRDFDLMVADLNIPDMDGIELIRQVRGIKPEQRIIAVTESPSHESQGEVFKLGALNYVVKPFHVERFLELVTDSLEGDGEDDGLVGSVQLACEDLIQMYVLEGKSVILEVQRGKDIGRIYFEKGRVVHAETDGRQGEEAFYEILPWRAGRFEARPLETETRHTINRSVTALLLEGSRLQNEQQNHSKLYAKEENMAISQEHLSPFAEVEGIRGVVVYTESGELLLDMMKTDMPLPPEAIAAFGAELSKFSRKVSTDLQLGTAEFCRIETPDAVMIHRSVESGAIGLSVIADSNANVGMIVYTMSKVIENIRAEGA